MQNAQVLNCAKVQVSLFLKKLRKNGIRLAFKFCQALFPFLCKVMLTLH